MRRLIERKSVENSGIMVTFLQLNFIVTVMESALFFFPELVSITQPGKHNGCQQNSSRPES